MATKLRLQRHGRKQRPFYYIVAADERAPRDGRFIERIGSYNPNTNPATIDLDLEASVRWLGNGAIPTNTVRAILSYRGALHKHHLNRGVLKGAFTQDEADKKFDAWLEEKTGRIDSKVEGLSTAAKEEAEKRFQAEKAIRDERAKKIIERDSELAGEVEAEAATEEAVEGDAVEASAETTEAPAAEAPAAEEPAAEEPAAETAEEGEAKE